jgi:hypothetical protein
MLVSNISKYPKPSAQSIEELHQFYSNCVLPLAAQPAGSTPSHGFVYSQSSDGAVEIGILASQKYAIVGGEARAQKAHDTHAQAIPTPIPATATPFVDVLREAVEVAPEKDSSDEDFDPSDVEENECYQSSEESSGEDSATSQSDDEDPFGDPSEDHVGKRQCTARNRASGRTSITATGDPEPLRAVQQRSKRSRSVSPAPTRPNRRTDPLTAGHPTPSNIMDASNTIAPHQAVGYGSVDEFPEENNLEASWRRICDMASNHGALSTRVRAAVDRFRKTLQELETKYMGTAKHNAYNSLYREVISAKVHDNPNALSPREFNRQNVLNRC